MAVIRATSINYVKFAKEAFKYYKESGKDNRLQKAFRRINKFLKQYPSETEYIDTELAKLGIKRQG